ncbi:substrate-binding domain-containing protein [Paraburkholderia sp. DHOC27]|uniref:substrate-binding domain-containing protein n=1 Tax=Paraburkholderia sp. DHOC27 TaxID=2303330 RepID=UPI000E3BA946|nr:substrate-binding domain-containing protein [Paraburkholderia sp. DHOC27]RFU49035.1 sugar ABC transporter substrate-binding protein [Paraburkholderia sp. DHOC27]
MKIGNQMMLVCALAGLTVGVAQADPIKVGVMPYGLKAEFMQMWTNAIKQDPAVKDGSVQIVVFDGNYDALTQSNQFDTMITQKYDAIIFAPIDKNAGAAAVAKAVAAHIPVIGSNTHVSGDQLTSYVGSDDVVAGRLEADAVVKAIGGKGNVVIIEGPIGQSAQIDRSKGIADVLAQHKDVKVLENKTANWSRAEALALVEDWLTSHPGQINGIIAENDEEALGAIQAMKSKGLDVKKIPVAGIDGVADGIEAAKRGEMTTFFQDAKAQSQGALDVALRAKIGPSYKPRSDVWAEYGSKMPWDGGTAKEYTVPWTQVTATNADAILKQVKEVSQQ